MDELYERMRSNLLEAIAEHERGELDHAGLRASLAGIHEALGDDQADVRESLFEADVALEYARHGQRLKLDAFHSGASLARMRRNLREALK